MGKVAYIPLSPPRRLEAWAAVLVGLVAVALYRHTFGFGFVDLDDDFNLLFNPHQGPPTLEHLRWMFTDMTYVRRYMPLGWLLFSVLFSFFGLDGGSYHVIATLFFALNSILVFVVLRQFLAAFAPVAGSGAFGVVAPLLGALWWVASPLRAESVAWVSGLLYGQALAFALIASWAVLASFGLRGAARLRCDGAAALAYFCSVLTYPMALGLAPALLVLEALWRRRQEGGLTRAEAGTMLLRRAPLLVAAALGVGIALFAQGQANAVFSGIKSWDSFSLLQRFEQAVYVFFYYLWKPLWPTGLSPIYGTLIIVNAHVPQIAASLVALAAGAALLAWSPRLRASLEAWLMIYLMVVFPVLGFNELPHITYDRYGLLPSVILAAGLTCLIARCRGHLPRALATGVMVGAIAACAVAARTQSMIWSSSEALYARIAAELPGAQLPIYKYRRRASMLAELGHYDQSRAVIDQAVALYPGSAFVIQMKKDLTERDEHYQALNAVTGEEVIPEARKHLSFAIDLSKAGHPAEAYEHLKIALRESPGFERARFNSAFVLLLLNRPDEALHAYLWTQRRMKLPLPPKNSSAFLLQYADLMALRGEPRLAEAARARAGEVMSAP